MSARYIVGDSLAVLRSLPDASVDLVLTSPPFLALRSYLPADHPDKAKEMGSEATPGAFIDALLDIVEECRRVLAPHGSLCIELGDTYSGSGGAGGDYNAGGLRDGQERFDGSASRAFGVGAAPRPPRTKTVRPNESMRFKPDGSVKTDRAKRRGEAKNVESLVPLNGGPGWPLDKSLCLIPESFRWALVYGRNPFTGRATESWRARNIVRWCRPNPPVGALGDKFRPATSEMVVACMSGKRYFDLDAVRGPGSPNTHARTARGIESRPSTGKTADDDTLHETAGAPPLDWWEISTEPYKGSHYATWPTALLVRPIKAMCPERVCRSCGEPSRRIVEVAHKANRSTNGPQSSERKHLDGGSAGFGVRADRVATTTGWTDCGHDDWRTGVVLDPFAGSGTTLSVATGHGRDAIGIDIDERNADLAEQRVGMWLTVEHFVTEVAS